MQAMARAGMALAVAGGVLVGGGAALAHWRGGGGVVVWGPAYPVYPAPHYYAPPYYAPPPRRAATEGCYAGAWVCPLDRPLAVGEPCACGTGQGPGGQGQAWGTAR